MPLPTIASLKEIIPRLEEWRQLLLRGLPDENVLVAPSRNTYFSIIDSKTIKFHFDPGANAEAHDIEWSEDPDFRNKKATRIYSDALEVEIPIHDAFSCSKKYYFRVRAVRGDKVTFWSPTAVFGTPVPGPLIGLTGAHTVDNVTEENPIININITLPRTAVLGALTIEDLEAVWTDHVDLEADWSALDGAIDDSTTTVNVTTGQGVFFKVGGFYKIESEIIQIASIATDALTVARAQLGTDAAAHADLVMVRFYARIIREQFHAADSGLFGVTVTIPNPEQVRSRDFEAWGVNRCGDRGAMASVTALLNAPALVADLAANPLFQKVTLTWSELPWTAYRYEIFHSTVAPINICAAAPEDDPNNEMLGRPLADHEGEASFTHHVGFVSGVTHHYAVRAVDIFRGHELPTCGDTVGPLQPDEFPMNPAGDVTSISASEGPACIGPGVPARARVFIQSSVTVGFTPPAPLNEWKSVNLYVKQIGKRAELSQAIDSSQTEMPVKSFLDGGVDKGGIRQIWVGSHYLIDSEIVQVTSIIFDDPTFGAHAIVVRAQQGTSPAAHVIDSDVFPSEEPRLVAAGDAAPLEFRFPPVGDVTLYFVSVARDGRENAVLSSPNLTVTLDAQTSPPLEVQDLFCQTAEHGAKVHWAEGKECDLDHYDVADLGNVTMASQSSIGDEHIVGQVPADPNSDRKASWAWSEVLFEGSTSGGGATIVMAADTFIIDSHNGKSLRFAFSSGDDVTETEYTILDTTVNTIVLTTTPTETSNGLVKFYVGGRTHKFYVRAVNAAGFASEWRPVETTFLECTPLAPDGTRDISVSKLRVIPPAALGTSVVAPGARAKGSIIDVGIEDRPGSIYVQLVADGEEEADNNFNTALKRSIGGIIAWEVKITHPGGTFIFSYPADTERSNYVWFDPGGAPLPRWQLTNRFFVPTTNMGINTVEARVRNYFGWSNFVALVATEFPSGAAPHFMGNSDLEKIAAEVQDGSDDVYPNLALTRRFTVEPTDNITIQDPEYRSDGTTKGGGLGVREGEIFYVTVEQPSGTPTRTVAFSTNYKGLDGKEVDMRVDRYTTWGFEVVSATKFRCISYLTGDI